MTTTIPIRTAPDLDLPDLAEALGEKHVAIVGRCIPYGEATNVGLYVEEFERGAFTESLAANAKVPLLWSHERGQLPVGVAEAWEERTDGLWARFRLSGNATAQVIATEVRDGFIGGLSVGFVPEKSRWTFVQDYNPDQGALDRVVRTKARLLEVSLTPTPAYAGALVADVLSEPLSELARSNLRRAQFQRSADTRIREHDHETTNRRRRQRELAEWRRWIEARKRP